MCSLIKLGRMKKCFPQKRKITAKKGEKNAKFFFKKKVIFALKKQNSPKL